MYCYPNPTTLSSGMHTPITPSPLTPSTPANPALHIPPFLQSLHPSLATVMLIWTSTPGSASSYWRTTSTTPSLCACISRRSTTTSRSCCCRQTSIRSSSRSSSHHNWNQRCPYVLSTLPPQNIYPSWSLKEPLIDLL